MSLQFLEAASHVYELLLQNKSSQKSIDEHRRCTKSLGAYLTDNHLDFSEANIIPWLEDIKQNRSWDTVCRYRRSAYRILLYATSGSIESDSGMFGHHEYQYYDSGRPYVSLCQFFKDIYQKYIADGVKRLSPSTMYHYRIPVSEFLNILEAAGVQSISDINLSHLDQVRSFFEDKKISKDKLKKSKSAIRDFLNYLIKDGLPWCYGYYLKVSTNVKDIPVLSENELTGFQRMDKPSKSLEDTFKSFSAEMDKRRYSFSFDETSKWILIHFFLFLEINHLAFSKESVVLWLSNVKHLAQYKPKRRYIQWFYEFSVHGTIGVNNDFAVSSALNSLPEWSRAILEDCISLKKREGMEPSTIDSYRSCGVQLFRFLDGHNVKCYEEITPEILMEFHKQDTHSTIEGKNATSAKIRKILLYMAEEKMVPYSYVLAITGSLAPVVKIPSVLSEEMVQSLYNFRNSASSPIEYRDISLIMLGLLMGLRACDVVNLRFEDINWKEQKISLTQKKTGVPIVLPMPTAAANSLYLYITKARPLPAASAEGVVFLKVIAPYDGITGTTATKALKTALKSQGFALEKKQGFHILRRTFASKLLQASVETDRITDALGHTSRNSVMKYLSMDEEGMRKCPLPFIEQPGGTYEKMGIQ